MSTLIDGLRRRYEELAGSYDLLASQVVGEPTDLELRDLESLDAEMTPLAERISGLIEVEQRKQSSLKAFESAGFSPRDGSAVPSTGGGSAPLVHAGSGATVTSERRRPPALTLGRDPAPVGGRGDTEPHAVQPAARNPGGGDDPGRCRVPGVVASRTVGCGGEDRREDPDQAGPGDGQPVRLSGRRVACGVG